LADPHQRKVIEDTILEIDEVLRAAAASPAVRELRVRHGALARVVRAWGPVGSAAPHAAQLGAMMECVLELRAAALKACPQRAREAGGHGGSRPPARPTARALPVKHMKTTRPPPRRSAANRSTRPPARARAGSVPPSSRRG
jgi:hypothetical protein